MSPGNAPEEMNVYQSAEARFEAAARKLGLEEGLYRFLKYPNKEITVYIPVDGQRPPGSLYGYRVLIPWCADRARAASASRRT